MDGIGALGALLAGWVAGYAFSNAFLLSGALALCALFACLSVAMPTSVPSPENPENQPTWVLVIESEKADYRWKFYWLSSQFIFKLTDQSIQK